MLRRNFAVLAAVFVAACSERTAPPPPKPTTLVLSGNALASAQVASAVTGISIIVNDEKGNAMAGQPLSVSVTGGGSLAGVPAVTQAGTTTMGTWTLGTKAGVNAMTITSGSLPPVMVSVQGTAGPPAKLAAIATVAAVATVGGRVTPNVQVQDLFGNPSVGVTVQFAVTGGGTLASASAVTDGNGIVVPAWTLGTLRGTNTLTATSGAGTVMLMVVAQADVPSTLRVTQGAGQRANAGTAVPQPPMVTVMDRFGNGTPRQTVAFVVAAGGGSITGATTAMTDTNGVATGPAWVLGKRNVPQQLSVSVGSVSLAINATIRALPITLRFFGTMTDAQKAIFQGAAQRVSAMITQGAGPVQASAFDIAAACGVTGALPITEVIDGVIIYASIGPIDGVGKILAESGPCGLRDGSASFQPAIASILFDVADLNALAVDGSLEDVATHEMMHALGFGTVWPLDFLISGTVNADPRYIGTNGITGCRSIAGATMCAATVPVENTGGPGTAGGHWRESVFGNELMTGYLNPGTNPLSAMTIAAMIDLGYSVSLTAADAYSFTSALRGQGGVRLLQDNWENVRTPLMPGQLEPAGGLLRARRMP